MALLQTGQGLQPRTTNSMSEPTASVDGHEHPAHDFAYVPDPAKPSTWKLPIFDASHVRNALARFDQTELPAEARAHVRARIEEAARKFGIDVNDHDGDEKSANLPEGYGWKALQDVSIDEGKVKAVVATFDVVDNDGEVILAGAIQDGMKATVSFYNHDTVMGHMLGMGTPDSPPVGKGVIRIEGSKAVAYLDYFMETQRGQEAFKTVKAMGADQAWSFAYRKQGVEKPSAEWQAKGARLMLTKLGPLLDGSMEVSPVKQPGGKGTRTLGTKAATAAPPPPVVPTVKDEPLFSPTVRRMLKKQ